MQLELKPTSATGTGAAPSSRTGRSRFTFERGQRTLGRSPDCDWQLAPDDPSVSRLHCVIERDRDGYLLRDESDHGSRLDGRLLQEGEVARLSDQSRLQIGNLSFVVRITGEQERPQEDPHTGLALSDERLTISAILSDIAPSGHTATGILGRGESEDLLPMRPAAKTGTPSSRNVEIGWSGPPEVKSSGTLLPDDWNAPAGSDFASSLVHAAAPRAAVSFSRAPKSSDALPLFLEEEAGPAQNPMFDAQPAEPVASRPASDMPRAPSTATRLEPLLRQLELALEAGFGVLDLRVPPSRASDFFGGVETDRLEARLSALVEQQLALTAALETMAARAGQVFDPRLLETRVDAGGRAMLPWLSEARYWQAYRRQFERDGHILSVRDLLQEAAMNPEDPARGPDTIDRQEGKTPHEE